MGTNSAISWTTHTFNPWIGCTKVSQGCKLCYAETQNHRYNWNPAGWGPGAPRKRTSETNWRKPIQWASQAVKLGVTQRVFCASLADVLDDEVDPLWRKDLFDLIGHTGEIGGLEWLILTKRPQNIIRMMPDRWLLAPPDFIRLGVTGENQECYDERTYFLEGWKGKNFISIEPILGPISIGSFIPDWIIVGGESGFGYRPLNINWVRYLRDQCRFAGIPFFMKQLGGHPDKRHDPALWPVDLRIQEFPGG